MKVIVNEETAANVGDVIEFNHKGSQGEGSHYLVCVSRDGYFILNLSGKKSNSIRYYGSLEALIKFHKDSIRNIYSKKQWDLALTKK